MMEDNRKVKEAVLIYWNGTGGLPEKSLNQSLQCMKTQSKFSGFLQRIDLYIICEGCMSLLDVASQVRSLETTIYYGGNSSSPQHHQSQVLSHPAVCRLFFCCPFPFMCSCSLFFFCPFSLFSSSSVSFPPTGSDLLAAC